MSGSKGLFACPPGDGVISRRVLLGALTLAILPPSAAGALPRIVVLSLSSPPDDARAFEEGLRTLGHAPGTTVAIDHRSAEGRAATLPTLAREAVGLHPQVIVAIGTTAGVLHPWATG
jgi:ABC-type uncharacterized transport system substrate-binding protein